MAIGYAALDFNAVQDVIIAACTGGAIAVDPGKVFIEAEPQAGGKLPQITIAMPQEPYEDDTWAGSDKLKNSIFKLYVFVVAELNVAATVPGGHPFGDATTPGLLTIADQVCDALDSAYSTLMAASPKNVDVANSSKVFTRNAAGVRQVVTRITVTFKVRFFAGNRS